MKNGNKEDQKGLDEWYQKRDGKNEFRKGCVIQWSKGVHWLESILKDSIYN